MSYLLKKNDVHILFENKNYVLVSKPSGLLTIPDRYNTSLSNLKGILQTIYGEIYTVHRLEKETSGVICFAKNTEAHKHLNIQFEQKKVKKIYWAFVEGRPEIDEGKIDIPIFNDLKNSGRMLIHSEGKEASTYFRLIQNYGKISLLEFYPVTGRTHQIRVHSRYLGCPLLIDRLYNGKEAFYLSSIKRYYKKDNYQKERPLVKRLTLHVKSLEFEDLDGHIIAVECDLHKDLRALKKQLEKSIT